MPRLITEVLEETLFAKKLPIVFSSATLSVKKDFSYIAYSLGIKNYQSFSVPSPFDYDEVMKIYLHELARKMSKAAKVEELLRDEEKTLILFKTKQAMNQFKSQLGMMARLKVGFEGDRELSAIVRDFQEWYG